METIVNAKTANLAPYPMEQLRVIKNSCRQSGLKLFDFGTGDPNIPLWPEIQQALYQSLSSVSSYPSIAGSSELNEAHAFYLRERHGLQASDKWMSIPTRGSKEAVFHIALSLVGRLGRRTIVYPDPGYPVYASSALFAGGKAYPYSLNPDNNYLLEPWKLPEEVIKDCCALWVNYPHNPTGAVVERAYWQELIAWCQQQNIVLLADECYVDIYMEKEGKAAHIPLSPLAISQDLVVSFFSLSKRSGTTGLRLGFMAGDSKILKPHLKARANFGLGQPNCMQAAALVAWRDEAHVKARRKIFSDRLEKWGSALQKLGLLENLPQATFYLWAKIPPSYGHEDVKFCMDIARKGFICTPSSWLGQSVKGYFRMSLVPDLDDFDEAYQILASFTNANA